MIKAPFLLFLATLTVFGQNPAVTVNIDANANRHSINPQIYGINYGTTSTLADLNSPLNRLGGNNTSRYNWQVNADNRGQRLVFREHRRHQRDARRARRHVHRGQPGGGARADAHDPDDRLGRKARRRIAAKLASFSIAKYGAQTGNDWQWYRRCGQRHSAGRRSSSRATIRTTRTCPADSASSRAGCKHLVTQWGTAGERAASRYYLLDNEPSIWSLHAPRRPSDGRDDGRRSATSIVDYRGA